MRSTPAPVRAALALMVALVPVIVALFLAPAVEAQPAPRIPRIGVIHERGPDDSWLAAFRDSLAELGYVEGRSVVIEYRYAQGDVDRFPAFAGELVKHKADVIVVGGALAARAAMAATKTTPIVFALVGDPVGQGIVASLARPGGNATGLSNAVHELAGKQLELLKSAVPKAGRIGILHNPLNSKLALASVDEAARALGVELLRQEVRQPGDIAPAFAALKARRVDAVLALSDPVFGGTNGLGRLAGLALESRTPAMYARKEFAERGGLLAYGPDFAANYRRAAVYVDKILRGAKAADLAVELPTNFDLVVNASTARAIGVNFPPSLLQRADRVIE